MSSIYLMSVSVLITKIPKNTKKEEQVFSDKICYKKQQTSKFEFLLTTTPQKKLNLDNAFIEPDFIFDSHLQYTDIS